MIHRKETSDPIIYPGWVKEECTHDRVTNLFVEAFISLVKDAELRNSIYKRDVKILETGFWYPCEYFTFLNETKQIEKIRLFKKNSYFFAGFPPKGFKQVEQANHAIKSKVLSYELDEQTAASEGLDNCQSTFSIIDCQMLIEIAMYKTCHIVMGTVEFNEYFKSERENSLRLDPNICDTPLVKFFKERTYSFEKLTTYILQKGAIVYFSNIPAYCEKHSNGDSQGFHAVCIEDHGERKFTAFGLSSTGVSNREILEILAKEMNKNKIENSSIYNEQIIEAKSAWISSKNTTFDTFPEVNEIKFTVENYLDMRDFHPEKVGLDSAVKYIDVDYLKTFCK